MYHFSHITGAGSGVKIAIKITGTGLSFPATGPVPLFHRNIRIKVETCISDCHRFRHVSDIKPELYSFQDDSWTHGKVHNLSGFCSAERWYCRQFIIEQSDSGLSRPQPGLRPDRLWFNLLRWLRRRYPRLADRNAYGYESIGYAIRPR